jgi:hypothetical protein
MRDIRIGLGRLVAPAAFFRYDEETKSYAFDLLREAYLGLDSLQAPGTGTNDNITAVQFKIRADEHEKTLINLLKHTYSSAGYSPQTFGLHDQGRAESGAALDIRERKTWTTNALKAQYWPSAIADLLFSALYIDRNKCGGPVEPIVPAVEMQDSMQSDYSQVAKTVQLIRAAKAASVETGVRMLHPDWDDGEVMREVERINTEESMGVPAPMEVGQD